MSTPTTFTEVINGWESVADFARDMGIPYQTAAAMKRRGSIDADHWPRLIEKAPARGLQGVTWESLAKMAAGVPAESQKGALPTQPLNVSIASNVSSKKRSRGSRSLIKTEARQ